MTIILTENGGAGKYYVYFSSALHYIADASSTAVSTDYDIAVANGANMATIVDRQTMTSGDRFQIEYYNLATNYKAYMKIVIDGKFQFTVYMQAQTYSEHSGRYAMHYVQMSVPSELKCFACGLCGDFNKYSTGFTVEEMEGCDGSDVSYRQGWSPTNQPEAYDTYGWTWEKHYTENVCTYNYDNTDNDQSQNGAVAIDINPCKDERFEKEVETECQNQVAQASDCCDMIGNKFCDGLLDDCKYDSCIAADGNVDIISETVKRFVSDPIEALCTMQQYGEQEFVNHLHVISNDLEKDYHSYYFIVGLTLILCGGALYWRRKNNAKFDGYYPLEDGETSSLI